MVASPRATRAIARLTEVGPRVAYVAFRTVTVPSRVAAVISFTFSRCMAPLAGFEPAHPILEVSCTLRLCYRGLWYNYSMDTYSVVCSECDQTFDSSRRNARYCSEACRKSNKRKRNTRSAVCQQCDSEFTYVEYSARERLYCSKSCSATVNNSLVPRRNSYIRIGRTAGVCVECVEEFVGQHNQRFCTSRCRNKYWNTTRVERTRALLSSKDTSDHSLCPECGGRKTSKATTCLDCSARFRSKKRIESWLAGEWSGGCPQRPYILSNTVRTYLLEQANYACARCGFNTPHPMDGASILEIDHVDGNPYNHSPDNLLVLCPNDHALTGSYRGRNAGKGRPYRYKLK
jgi:hypothetical protein